FPSHRRGRNAATRPRSAIRRCLPDSLPLPAPPPRQNGLPSLTHRPSLAYQAQLFPAHRTQKEPCLPPPLSQVARRSTSLEGAVRTLSARIPHRPFPLEFPDRLRLLWTHPPMFPFEESYEMERQQALRRLSV